MFLFLSPSPSTKLMFTDCLLYPGGKFTCKFFVLRDSTGFQKDSALILKSSLLYIRLLIALLFLSFSPPLSCHKKEHSFAYHSSSILFFARSFLAWTIGPFQFSLLNFEVCKLPSNIHSSLFSNAP